MKLFACILALAVSTVAYADQHEPVTWSDEQNSQRYVYGGVSFGDSHNAIEETEWLTVGVQAKWIGGEVSIANKDDFTTSNGRGFEQLAYGGDVIAYPLPGKRVQPYIGMGVARIRHRFEPTTYEGNCTTYYSISKGEWRECETLTRPGRTIVNDEITAQVGLRFFDKCGKFGGGLSVHTLRGLGVHAGWKF